MHCKTCETCDGRAEDVHMTCRSSDMQSHDVKAF